MNTFKCNITGSTSDVALAKAQVPRRCGADPDFGKPEAVPGNCTYGAKQPFYWFQKERNNVRPLLPARPAPGHRPCRTVPDAHLPCRCSRTRTRRRSTRTCTTSWTAPRMISSWTRTPMVSLSPVRSRRSSRPQSYRRVPLLVLLLRRARFRRLLQRALLAHLLRLPRRQPKRTNPLHHLRQPPSLNLRAGRACGVRSRPRKL